MHAKALKLLVFYFPEPRLEIYQDSARISGDKLLPPNIVVPEVLYPPHTAKSTTSSLLDPDNNDIAVIAVLYFISHPSHS